MLQPLKTQHLPGAPEPFAISIEYARVATLLLQQSSIAGLSGPCVHASAHGTNPGSLSVAVPALALRHRVIGKAFAELGEEPVCLVVSALATQCFNFLQPFFWPRRLELID